jgi:GDPmannose 4,6-dehydratase
MRALICGVSGQDGTYLARLLLEKGYEVWGTSRDANMSSFANLRRFGIRDRINVESMTLTDFRSVLQALKKIEPAEIYNLAGQTSVSLSFEQPVETFETITIGALNLLEAIRFAKLPAKLYNACSGECFGNTGGVPADESTAFRPRSPYAVARAAAFWEVANYREAYGLHACSGILFNHESPLRPERFVTQKIVSAAVRIARGSKETLELGDITIERDWGWADEYVVAMWLMLQLEKPEDYVIATGQSHTLSDFLEETFGQLDLDWHDHVVLSRTLLRPADIQISRARPDKASRDLGWNAAFRMREVVRGMIAGISEEGETEDLSLSHWRTGNPACPGKR